MKSKNFSHEQLVVTDCLFIIVEIKSCTRNKFSTKFYLFTFNILECVKVA